MGIVVLRRPWVFNKVDGRGVDPVVVRGIEQRDFLCAVLCSIVLNDDQQGLGNAFNAGTGGCCIQSIGY
jgi:hypothetical protein